MPEIAAKDKEPTTTPKQPTRLADRRPSGGSAPSAAAGRTSPSDVSARPSSSSSSSPQSSRSKWDEDGVAALYYQATCRNPFLVPQVEEQGSMVRKAFDCLPRSTMTPVTLVDVGCGGGLLLSLAANKLPNPLLVGVDLDQTTLNFARSRLLQEGVPDERLTTLAGDATQLRALLHNNADAACKVTTSTSAKNRIIASCGNTLGIMPDDVRVAVVAEMFLLARPSAAHEGSSDCTTGDEGEDCLCFHFFHAAEMRRGMTEYYHAHPELTGSPVSVEDFDFERARLHVAQSGYTSQWFDEKLATQLFEAAVAKAREQEPALTVKFDFYAKGGGLYAIGQRTA